MERLKMEGMRWMFCDYSLGLKDGWLFVICAKSLAWLESLSLHLAKI